MALRLSSLGGLVAFAEKNPAVLVGLLAIALPAVLATLATRLSKAEPEIFFCFVGFSALCLGYAAWALWLVLAHMGEAKHGPSK